MAIVIDIQLVVVFIRKWNGNKFEKFGRIQCLFLFRHVYDYYCSHSRQQLTRKMSIRRNEHSKWEGMIELICNDVYNVYKWQQQRCEYNTHTHTRSSHSRVLQTHKKSWHFNFFNLYLPCRTRTQHNFIWYLFHIAFSIVAYLCRRHWIGMELNADWMSCRIVSNDNIFVRFFPLISVGRCWSEIGCFNRATVTWKMTDIIILWHNSQWKLLIRRESGMQERRRQRKKKIHQKIRRMWRCEGWTSNTQKGLCRIQPNFGFAVEF